MKNKKLLIIICLLSYVTDLNSQDKVIDQLPAKYFEQISRKTKNLQKKLSTRSDKILARLNRAEKELKKKLAKIDSLSANSLFPGAKTKYNHVEEKLTDRKISAHYEPRLDSLVTVFKFLEQNPEWLGNASQTEIELKDAFVRVKELESQFQRADHIRQFLNERRQVFNEQLEKFGFTRELKKLNKEDYYYTQQLNAWRQVLRDPTSLPGKVIEVLSKTKQFRDFFRKNSMLASLFPIPFDPNDPAYLSNLAGLQTRAQINSLIQNQIAMGGGNAQQQFNMNLQAAQSQLNQLKDKIYQLGGESGEDIVPEKFKPNSQKTRSFWQRIELGSNIQSQRATNQFPVTSDLGLSIAYKLRDEAAVGFGTSYKLGWGKGWNNIRITHQGFSIRTFIDCKLKGSIWITGGYEQNYKSLIRNIDQLRDQSSWQKSGLVGISKIIAVNNKLFRNTKLQLLWDFLSYSQVPAPPPILFRIGYNLK